MAERRAGRVPRVPLLHELLLLLLRELLLLLVLRGGELIVLLEVRAAAEA